jgi:Putative beta-barrel porin-2, OmpL-like. bbp2
MRALPQLVFIGLLIVIPAIVPAQHSRATGGGARPSGAAQWSEIRLEQDEGTELAEPDIGAIRISGSFIGSVNYNSHIQMVPEFAGNAPVSSEPDSVDFRFDQFTIGAFKTFAPWLSAGASIEVERHGHRHSHGLDPEFGCPGAGPCIEQFGAEEIETEVSLHRFSVTAIAPLGNGLALVLGRFDVPFGYERHDAPLNLTATISELQRFGRPQSMTGLQVSYPITPWLDATAWIVNRWENETTEDPPEDNNRPKSVGGRIGWTPLQAAQLLNVGVGGWWGEERDDDDGADSRWLIDVDMTWSPFTTLLLAAEVAYGGEPGVSFRERGAPFAAPAVSDRDVNWLGAYALVHYDVMTWLGFTVRYGIFDDQEGARTGVEQVLQSVTIAPIFHLSRLVPGLRPPGVSFARTRHPLDWVDVRLEYRLNHSNQPVFSDAAPGTPVLAAAKNAHQVTLQSVVSF